MPATLIDGNSIATRIDHEVRAGVTALVARGVQPRLAGVLVGADDGSRMYAASQGRAALAAGIEHRAVELPADAAMAGVLAAIDALNRDPAVHGILLYQPLPAGLDLVVLQSAIALAKDVEGVNPANLGLLAIGRPALAPCTAAAAFECVKSTGVEIAGRDAVVVGRSPIVGRPAAMLLLAAHATVTVCHTRTMELADHCRRADILIVAAGKPGMIGHEHVRHGAVVIDVGTHRVKVVDDHGGHKMRTMGDVRIDEIMDLAAWVTPVPGGVGPVTVAMLLANVVEAARRQSGA